MKTTKQILLAVILLIFATKVNAQWTITSGPGTANGNILYRVGETMYAGTYAGAYKSTDNGNTWNAINNGLGADRNVYDFCYLDGKLWCCAFSSGLYFSTNNGDNWIREYGLLSGDAFRVALNNQYVLLSNWNSSGVLSSTNTGSNWVSMNGGSGIPTTTRAFAFNGNKIYAASYAGFHIAFLGGTAWTRVNGNLANNSVEMNDMKYFNNKIYITTEAGVWTSSNEGANWTNLNLPLSNIPIKTLSVLDQNIFIGTSDNLYLSTNDGANWNSIYQGLPTSTIIRSIAYNSNYFFVMLLTGTVYRRPLSDFGIVGIQNISSQVPDNFNLSQNYPNPFNPTTNINFTVPKSGLVKMIVYDIKGREISTLVNEEMRPGSYKVDFDGSNLSSGIYYYTMTSVDFVETKKMMLVK